MLSKDVELRKVPRRIVREVSLYLEKDDDWKELMSTIPKDLSVLDDPSMDISCLVREPKYGPKHFLLIELGAKKGNKMCGEVLFDEWGTSGRRRPTLKDLLRLLQLNGSYQAADYIAEVCGEEPVERPEDGPFARIDSDFLHLRRTQEGELLHGEPDSQVELSSSSTVSDTTEIESQLERTAVRSVDEVLSEMLTSEDTERPREEEKNFPEIPRRALEKETLNSPVPHIPYKVLRKITNHFDGGDPPGRCQPEPGQQLGCGGSGTVYLGGFSDGKLVAVKRIDREKVRMDLVTRQFVMEVENVAKFCPHPNILEILGFSVDGPYPCVVYDFLPEGSVLDHILGRCGKSVLSWRTRLKIARETALGLEHFHRSGPVPLIHRDVKSANILLDKHLTAKLADYGFARFAATEEDETGFSKTSNVVGTHAYMAPEAFRGDVSVKLDTFGFGVVMLELVTGMPGYDHKKTHPGKDLLGFLKAEIDADYRRITRFLDPKADWDAESASGFAKIAFFCVKDKTERPTMSIVVKALDALCTVSKT